MRPGPCAEGGDLVWQSAERAVATFVRPGRRRASVELAGPAPISNGSSKRADARSTARGSA